MKSYLKYLIKNPGKLLFSMIIIFLVSLGFYEILSNMESLLQDNSLGLLIFVMVLMVVVLFAGIYQPYKEWKDLD